MIDRDIYMLKLMESKDKRIIKTIKSFRKHSTTITMTGIFKIVFNCKY